MTKPNSVWSCNTGLGAFVLQLQTKRNKYLIQLLVGTWVGQSPQILPEPELIMSTGVAAVAVAIITWSAQKAEPLRQLCDDLGCYLLLDLSASCEAVNAEHICMSELVGAAVECVNMF